MKEKRNGQIEKKIFKQAKFIKFVIIMYNVFLLLFVVKEIKLKKIYGLTEIIF